MKIAINGFGRIGRCTFRIIANEYSNLEVVTINDLTDAKTLAHLLKYDSSYGIFDQEVKSDGDVLIVGKRKIKVFAEKDPSNLPWKDLGVDVVLECTGVFRDYEGCKKHIDAGAKKVIISAPSKDPAKINSYVIGINENDFDAKKDEVMDMGSCTTNCLANVCKVLDDNFGIVKGFMTTIHSYTNDQKILDLAHKDLRRARTAGLNIIPTTTGAAKAISRVLPQLEGKLDGIAMRVPTATVSVVDLVCEIEKNVSVEEVNKAFEKAAGNLKGILDVSNEPLVSIDYKGNSNSAIIDLEQTMVNGNMIKVVAWYDNEWGYSHRFADFCNFISKKI